MNIFAKMKSPYTFAVICALLSAIFASAAVPFKKVTLSGIDPITGTVFLQLGIGLGALITCLIKAGLTTKTPKKPEEKIQKSDIKFILLTVLVATGTTILMNFGLAASSAATASVLSNFELVATALIALLLFREKITKRLWIGILLITIGSITLSLKDAASFVFTAGSILILLSAVGYGFKHNLMKILSKRNPFVITMIFGFGGALITLIPALCLGITFPAVTTILLIMLVGFATTGLTNIFMMYAQRRLGTAKTGAIRGIAPVLSVIISCIVFAELPTIGFIASLILVLPGLYFAITRKKETIDEIRFESAEEDTDSSLASEKYEQGRKYFTTFGCLIIACLFGFFLISKFDKTSLFSQYADELGSIDAGFSTPMFLITILLLVCGVTLLILRRRVIAAVSFIFLAVMMMMINILGNYIYFEAGLGIAAICFGLLLFTSRGKQKFVYAPVSILFGACTLTAYFIPGNAGFITQTLLALTAIIILTYTSIASVSERKNLPLSKLLSTYEKTDFKTCVPVLGYSIIAIYETGSLFYLLFDIEKLETMSSETFYLVVLLLGGILVLIGFLLLFIGKMGFLSIMFIGFGFCIWAESYAGKLAMYCIAAIFLVLGVCALCRSYSNILRSMLLILSGLTYMLYPLYWISKDILPSLIGMTALILLVALYMAVSSISDKPRLPVF